MDSCFIISLCLSSSFFFFINIFSTEAAPKYLFHDCPNTTLFTPNSTYRSNLRILLSSLSSAATGSADGFAHAAAGQNPPDRAYGLFLCRGDLNSNTCSHCVATGKRDILRRCPKQRVSLIWYDQCMLRYSNWSILSAMEQSPDRVLYDDIGNVTDPTRFMQLLGETLNDIATRASAGGSGKKVAVAEANFTNSQKLYALVQCTPYLTASDCVKCLQFRIANLPQGKQGGRLLAPSCNLRYELYPFYNASALPSPAPPPPAPAPPPPAPAPAPPPPAPVTGPEGKSNQTVVIMIAVITTLVFLFLVWCIRRRNATKTHASVQGDQIGLTEITNSAPLQYNLTTILVATNNFSNENKLGNGRFGEVFLGMLLNGVLIAVKRLSQSSRQGVEEFKNEVMLLPKLQHRNVVQLLGFCLEGVEKLLVYEFVQNKSLDSFLFDPEKSRHLDWSTRYKIAYGIARGMHYLHEDSRLRIIHLDLKSSNILLDSEMNPKISDFGMARIFSVDQTPANTERIAGTRGYMSPEYAMNGQFSMKSDVYSFGVLLLELISGNKNSSFHQAYGGGGIASYAWKIWRDEIPLAVLDPTIGDMYSRDEVIRCLKIGLLCTQEDPNHRPTMADIVRELTSLPVTLEKPKRPAFFPSRIERSMEELESDQSTGRLMPLSTNEMSDQSIGRLI